MFNKILEKTKLNNKLKKTKQEPQFNDELIGDMQINELKPEEGNSKR